MSNWPQPALPRGQEHSLGQKRSRAWCMLGRSCSTLHLQRNSLFHRIPRHCWHSQAESLPGLIVAFCFHENRQNALVSKAKHQSPLLFPALPKALSQQTHLLISALFWSIIQLNYRQHKDLYEVPRPSWLPKTAVQELWCAQNSLWPWTAALVNRCISAGQYFGGKCSFSGTDILT